MATDNTKGDIINRAFSALRISGVTVDPSPSDLELALNKLENMAAEFAGRNICTNYFFEDEPDPNTPHNMERKFWHSFDVLLAVRLMPNFGKGEKPDVVLIRQGSAGFSFLSSATARVNPVQYPSRMPKGSGTTLLRRWGKFFETQDRSPNSCLTKTMYIDDIRTFTENFDSILEDGDDISAYTIEANTGLTINSDSLTTPIVTYNVTADGNSDGTGIPYLNVKIIVTTTDGIVETRIINFRILASDID